MGDRAVTWIVVVAAAAAMVTGCVRSTAPVADHAGYDSAKARQILVAALEAWKAGQRAAFDGQRPIRLADDDRAAGWKLVSFQIDDSGGPLRAFEGIRVNLTLRNQGGDTVTRKAAYQVSLEPELAVLRSES